MNAPKNIVLTLNRISYNADGTPGHIQAGPHCFGTLEPPWRDNKPGLSCIPAGTYRVTFEGTPHYPKHPTLLDVPGRAGIVIHSGNYAGDTERGYVTDTQGCILIGRAASLMAPNQRRQRAVVLSRSCLKAFTEYLAAAPFTLVINPPLSDGGTIYPEPDAIMDEQRRWQRCMAP